MQGDALKTLRDQLKDKRPDDRSVKSTLASMAKLSLLGGLLVAGLLIPPTAFATLTVSSVTDEISALPMELREEPVPQRTRVLAADGSTLAYFYSQNRQSVPLKKVAPVMREALLAIEDYRFYEHGPLDLRGTLRAVANNATDQSVQGGSTITQQLVKMTLIQQAKNREEMRAASEQTVTRKVRELKYAMSYEQEHSKDEILENYLNIAYFGDGAYGVSAAAKHFFSVEPDKLNLVQSATIAGLVKNPVQYDPTVYPERAIQRRNTVLSVMRRQGKISQAEADEAMASPLGLKITKFSNGCTTSYGAFACDYVRRYLLNDPDLGSSVEERKATLESGGLVIHTTVNKNMQKAANKAAKEHVAAKDQAIGALAMVVPGKGDVKALSQSRPMGRKQKQGQTYINYTVPRKYGDSGGFQAGSTFKIFSAVAALKNGIPASRTYPTPSAMVIPYGAYRDCDGGPTSQWRVKGGGGSNNLYTGLQRSVNTYFAQLEREAGLCNTVEAARSMGIKVPKRNEVPSFTLGITETSPLEVAGAFATLASGGTYCEPRPVRRIEDQNGKLVKKYDPKCKRVMDSSVANTINAALQGVSGKQHIRVPSAGKTGTIQNNRAVWYAGYTPTLSTTAMIAGANSKGHPITLSGQVVNGRRLGAAFGASVAAPMWGTAMRQIDDKLKPVGFGAAPPPPRVEPPKKNDDDQNRDNNRNRGNDDD